MREIKFRGKRIDNGEWVIGDFTRYSAKFSYINQDLIENDVHEVDTETVGQFTGLEDKNGVELYEEDKFRYLKHDGYWADDFIGVVGFEEGCFGYDIITEQSGISNEFHPFAYNDELKKEDFLDHIEVIGNIHDKHKQKQALIDMMRGDEELGLYDD